MEILMGDSKTRLLLLILVVVLNQNLLFSQTLVAEISFQDFFESDTISVFIEGRLVIKDEVITSEMDTGLTSLLLLLIDNGEVFVLKTRKDNYLLPFLRRSNILRLKIQMNGKDFLYDINLLKGIFIGFDKVKPNQLILNQSPFPIEYD